jgi:hypothetical protein
MTRLNERPAVCKVTGCRAAVHGQGLCRVHYDRDRYQRTIGSTPEAVEARRREQAIEGELQFGCVAEWVSPHGTNSMFATDEERREAWEERREALMERYLTPPRRVGGRPQDWWDYVAGRDEHLLEDPPLLGFKGTEDEHAAALDEYENEPIIWLAENGHLTAEEIADLAEEANEARPRIGTEAEEIGSGGVDRADRRAVKLYEAVEAALGVA